MKRTLLEIRNKHAHILHFSKARKKFVGTECPLIREVLLCMHYKYIK